MTNSTPNRTHYVADLIAMLADAAKVWADGYRTPAHTNMTLAMCEVAMSLPPVWFDPYEKLLIVNTVRILYGDAHKFLSDIEDESVSFYAKYCAANGLPLDGLDRIVAACHSAHEKEFGRATI